MGRIRQHWSCHLSGFHPESASSDMSSPGAEFNHCFSGSPSHHTVNFYFILFFYLRSFEVRDICWRFTNYLNFIRGYGNIAHCKSDVILNITQFCVEQKFSQSPSVTRMSRGFFRSLAIPGPTEGTA
jgi:hypothetical protein